MHARFGAALSTETAYHSPLPTPHSVDHRVRSIIAGDAIAGPAAIAGYCPTEDSRALWSANRHHPLNELMLTVAHLNRSSYSTVCTSPPMVDLGSVGAATKLTIDR